MALADTARLIASLVLEDKFSATATKFDRTVAGMDRRTATFERIGGHIGDGIRNTAQNLTRLAVVGGGVIAANVTAGVRSLAALESVETQTKAVLESTRSAAGLTAVEIGLLAEKYEDLNATVDNKVIQSGENLLLTFTNIRKEAFEPALQAALDMNQAMGGGEEGLQETIIRVGKALQDPIRGSAQLRRVGVNLTKQQEEQIRKLVEANDLYGAQKLILEELGTEFGGSFAAAGDTAAGKFAKVQDAVEDAQMSLATAFLPVLEKVGDKLATFLADENVQRQIEEFGKGLAGGLDQVIDFAGKVPWGTIGDSLKIAGAGAKAVLDAFTSLPSWIQTAVITGWGLNKLTGGALGGLAGTLAKALLPGGGLRGSTPATPLFVSDVAGALGGKGGVPGVAAPVAGGFGKGVLAGAGRAFGLAAVVTIGAEIGKTIGQELFLNPTVKPALDFETAEFDKFLKRAEGDPTKLTAGLSAIESEIQKVAGNTVDPLERWLIPQLAVLEEQRDTLRTKLEEIKSNASNASSAATGWSQRHQSAFARLNAEQTRTIAANNAAANRVREATAGGFTRNNQLQSEAIGVQRTIAAKDFSPEVNVTVNTLLSISDVQRRITSQRIAIGRGPLES